MPNYIRERMTADYRDGWLCVLWEEVDRYDPVLCRTWYPCYQIPRADAVNLIGRQAHRENNGRYTVKTSTRPGCGHWVALPLLEGGQTKPLHFERVAIPCPKVRAGLDVRYHGGAWQKQLKSSGWTDLDDNAIAPYFADPAPTYA